MVDLSQSVGNLDARGLGVLDVANFPPLCAVHSSVAIEVGSGLGKEWNLLDQTLPFFPSVVCEGRRKLVKPHLDVLVDGARQWENSLLGRFLGKSPPLAIFQMTVDKLWGREGSITIRFLAPSVYILNFPSKKRRSVSGRLLLLGDHIMVYSKVITLFFGNVDNLQVVVSADYGHNSVKTVEPVSIKNVDTGETVNVAIGSIVESVDAVAEGTIVSETIDVETVVSVVTIAVDISQTVETVENVSVGAVVDLVTVETATSVENVVDFANVKVAANVADFHAEGIEGLELGVNPFDIDEHGGSPRKVRAVVDGVAVLMNQLKPIGKGKELSALLGVEEKFLRQKSRVQFIKDDDRNSAYFFRQVAARQSSNTIQVLHDSQGQKLDTFEGISAELIRHFSEALGASNSGVVQFPDEFLKKILGMELTEAMRDSLGTFDFQEIK
ncbi:hypothetical protein V6N11_037643 [Hibiscus sabdariffa]|uniref:DUF4283 domain-containing protein n=1 Tax=Hibiscus sabdariffa TaxID=183260 RepID=A0ABR2PC89_9ROSI